MEGVRVSKLFIYDPETQHHQGVDPTGYFLLYFEKAKIFFSHIDF